MNLGPFSVLKWIPATQAQPTPALQNMLPKLSEKEKKLKLKRKSYGVRPSIGGNMITSTARNNYATRGGVGVAMNGPSRDSFGGGLSASGAGSSSSSSIGGVGGVPMSMGVTNVTSPQIVNV